MSYGLIVIVRLKRWMSKPPTRLKSKYVGPQWHTTTLAIPFGEAIGQNWNALG